MSRKKPRLLRRAHTFVRSAADPQRCAACPLPEENQVHDPDNIRQEAERQAQYARRFGESED
jgi:hypothetical protein